MAEDLTGIDDAGELLVEHDPAELVERDLADVPLSSLSLPTRLFHWADRKGITTLRELARIHPRDLLAERNMGRTTVAETRVVIEERFGRRWEDLAADACGPVATAAAAPVRWDQLRVALPEALLPVTLDEIDLPARVCSYAERERLRTVADLAGRSEAELCSASNMGRRSVQQVFEAVRDHLQRVQAIRERASSGLLESWKAFLHDQDPIPRMVLTLRAGLGGGAEKLQPLGEMLGVTRERIRQIESRVVEDLGREKSWLAEVRARIDAALHGGATPLETLAGDPWWARMVALPEALDYFGERLLGGEIRVVELDEHLYLARCSQDALDQAWSDLRRAAAEVPVPAPLSAFQSLNAATRARVGDVLAGALAERLRGLMHFDEGGLRVTGFGGTRAAAVLATLRASPAPMRIELVLGQHGRGPHPEELLWFGKGLVGLEQHFPDFSAWMDRLVPAAIRVMERDAPERQWLSSELLEELREEQDLPEWLSEWHLGSLLRRSGRVRYLGRSRVALLDAPDEHGRLHFHEEMLRILREHGAPMARDELFAALRRRTSANDLTVSIVLSRPQFLRCSDDRVGLLERDLPGGAEALAAAVEHTATLLEHRQRGLAAAELRAGLACLSPDHARWSPEMCLSICRGDSRFRLSQAGAVGLAGWESVRVPTRAELVRQCLDEAGGRVSVEVVERRIEAYYGESPGRVRIGLMANRFGAGLRGAWLERGPGEATAGEDTRDGKDDGNW